MTPWLPEVKKKRNYDVGSYNRQKQFTNFIEFHSNIPPVGG